MFPIVSQSESGDELRELMLGEEAAADDEQPDPLAPGRILSSGQRRHVKALMILNILWSTALLTISLSLWSSTGNSICESGPPPPYSPLREDGALRYVNKKFKYDPSFMGGPSKQLDDAWNTILGPSDGIVKLPKSKADKLYPSSEIYYEPGYHIYGVSMFHQLHCLNTIRQSFHPDVYFANSTKLLYLIHRNHCIEFLRQAIMCSGDSSMTYWWNDAYTYKDSKGVQHYSEKYLNMSPKDRAYSSFLLWDVEHQCRDFGQIRLWTEKNQLRDEAYWKEAPNFKKYRPPEA